MTSDFESSNNPLGKSSDYPDAYDPSVLYAIERRLGRDGLGLDSVLPMHGHDYWRAFELSWLDIQGKPQVAMGEFLFDAGSEFIVESKSLKLYLNSLNQHRFKNEQQVTNLVSSDLSTLLKVSVNFTLKALVAGDLATISTPVGQCLDHLDIRQPSQGADTSLLTLTGNTVVNQGLYSNLFKSNCPVTGQPDWATVYITYSGAEIDRSSLLSYICSFRSHQGFHEECAERMYCDLLKCCKAEKLSVALNFLRRGGLDINPCRSTHAILPKDFSKRFIRQ